MLFIDTALINREKNTSQRDEYLMRMLDKGTDDMEVDPDGKEISQDGAHDYTEPSSHTISEHIETMNGWSFQYNEDIW